MAARGRPTAWLWTAIGLLAAGAVALVVVACVDLGAAGSLAGVVGGVCALMGLGTSGYALYQGRTTPHVQAVAARSVAAGGSVGVAVTGDGASAGPAPAMPGTPPSGGTVTASGERSVAAGGDIGSVSTGDA
ncbi:hypothetical protein ACGFRG_06855 [Streptomyces sp. NPDC048696]|uniref:hypothetical protein n=1 Tax=Streptomyces sp. NPDC048696 TaxID=3365585 RepID=UPI00371C593A